MEKARQGPRFSDNLSSHCLKTDCARYDLSFPYFREPAEIGHFSLDDQRNFHNDGHQLKNYHPPRDLSRCHLDLRQGYTERISRDESVKEYIDTLLRWIMANKNRFIIKNTPIIDKHTGESSKSKNVECSENSTFKRSVDFRAYSFLFTNSCTACTVSISIMFTVKMWFVFKPNF